jgi:hypothetical protein
MRQAFRYHYPLDPDCPEVKEMMDGFWEDPITRSSGCGGEILEDFERRHRANCKRCQEYGAANVDVVGP